MMGDVMVVAVIWAWRCGSGARYGAHASADRRTDASTTSAARDRADYRPSAGADQTAAHRAIGGIVRVRDGCGRQHKSSADHAGYGRLLCHSLSTEKLREWGRLLDQLAIEVQLNSRCNGTNKWHGVAVPVPAAPALLPHPLPLTGQLGVARTAAAPLRRGAVQALDRRLRRSTRRSLRSPPRPGENADCGAFARKG